MKKQFLGMLLALSVSISSVFGADNQQKQIKATAEEIDKLIVQKPRMGYVKAPSGKKTTKIFAPTKPETYYPVLAQLLKMEQQQLGSALKKTQFQLSDVIFARILSAKKGVPIEQVLQDRSTDSWMRQLAKNDIPLDQVQSALQNIYVEMAFLSLGS